MTCTDGASTNLATCAAIGATLGTGCHLLGSGSTSTCDPGELTAYWAPPQTEQLYTEHVASCFCESLVVNVGMRYQFLFRSSKS